MSNQNLPDIGAKIVAMAAYRLGEGEVPPGSNRGPLPDKAYKYVHGPDADPAEVSEADREWCAEYACLCKHDALIALGLADNDLKTASTGGIHAWGVRHGKQVCCPKPGDFGLVKDATTPTGYRHTVIVEWVIGEIIHTIEGNESDRVERNTRTKASMDYVRPY